MRVYEEHTLVEAKWKAAQVQIEQSMAEQAAAEQLQTDIQRELADRYASSLEKIKVEDKHVLHTSCRTRVPV